MSTLERMKALSDRKAKIDAQLAQLKRRQAANERKEDTRLKVLIGAAVLADLKLNPQTGAFVQEVLQRAILAERDRQFLRAKGWLPEEKSAGQ